MEMATLTMAGGIFGIGKECGQCQRVLSMCAFGVWNLVQLVQAICTILSIMILTVSYIDMSYQLSDCIVLLRGAVPKIHRTTGLSAVFQPDMLHRATLINVQMLVVSISARFVLGNGNKRTQGNHSDS